MMSRPTALHVCLIVTELKSRYWQGMTSLTLLRSVSNARLCLDKISCNFTIEIDSHLTVGICSASLSLTAGLPVYSRSPGNSSILVLILR